MFIGDLTETELKIVVTALKYWRANRRGTPVRRSDGVVAPDALDLLIARLETGTLTSLPPDPGAARILHR